MHQILTAVSAVALSMAAGNRALASEAEIDRDIREATALVEFVIVRSTSSYDEARRTAVEAAKRLRLPMDLRDLAPTLEGGLTFPKAVCEEIRPPCVSGLT